MTPFDRIEPLLPDLMADLAPATMPDYFDDMLRQTARTRQRFAWSSRERWLPMDISAQLTPLRAPSLRPLVLLAVLALAAVASAIIYAGAQPRLPAPFGPAANGVIVTSRDGDIVAFDPSSGAVTTLVGGPWTDLGPLFSQDGRRFLFVRQISVSAEALWIANANGSGSRELVPAGRVIDSFEFSPAGDRVVVQRTIAGVPTTMVVDVEKGTETALDVGIKVVGPMWRPNGTQLVFASEVQGKRSFWIVNADGTDARQIETSRWVIDDPVLSPDGSLLVYSTWQDAAGLNGRIHITDIDGGGSQELSFVGGSPETNELAPRFSPDGTRLLLERYQPEGGYRLVVVPVDGGGPVTELGEPHATQSGGTMAAFSPDGMKVLVTYNDDGTTWLYDIATGDGEQLPWSGMDGMTWQRVAP